MVTPWNSTSLAAVRGSTWVGDSMRFSSSIAAGQSDGIAHEQRALLRVAGEHHDAGPDEARRGVVAGEHEEEAEAEQLFVGELLAVDLGTDERGHHVAARLRTPFGEELGEQAVDVGRGLARSHPNP